MANLKNIDRSAANSNKAVVISGAAVILLFFISLSIGKFRLSIWDILEILSGIHGNEMAVKVFFGLRLPRNIMALMAGMGLGVAGNIFQSIFKNPLASPDIIGVTSGASAGAAFCIVFLSGGIFAITFGAFLGGIIAISFVIGLVRLSRTRDIKTYVLSGIVINAISNGTIMTLKYFADPEKELGAIEFWAMGSLGGITLEKLSKVLPFFCAGIIGIYLFRWTISILSLSDEEAGALGVNVGQSRFLILLLSTLTVASIICVTGLISFVALISPHVARAIVKRNSFKATLLSGLLGSILMIISDCLARSLLYSELPVSIITSFIGAPYLAVLVGRKRWSMGEKYESQ
ncbi:MAG: iron ABC transporter permease [Clostridiales bacterium]|nr:iron ABC transporter permease [Clostridiales bacterium]